MERLKAVRNYALDSEDYHVQAIGHILNTVYLAEKNGDTLELMKVMACFMITKSAQNEDNDGK